MKSFPRLGDRRRRRIGVLGGSFNPAHEGHLHISREALKRLGLHQVWWLVSPQNPLKPQADMADLAQRLASARALAADPRIVVGNLESRLGVIRTARTLTMLRRRYPRLTLVWLMGADNLQQIPKWWRWTRIFRTARVAVLDRSPYSYAALAGKAAQRFRRMRTKAARVVLKRRLPAWSYLGIRRHGASSTALRAAQKI
ncbi:MAG: nicotinate-nucleotide adenylyltransferase [Rhodospirillaceae bacterium]|nr:nicotinate-nucleotide adenylyltransferase [Rhodospirillaceae bacterium]